jgi:class 3 adenylate cyclase
VTMNATVQQLDQVEAGTGINTDQRCLINAAASTWTGSPMRMRSRVTEAALSSTAALPHDAIISQKLGRHPAQPPLRLTARCYGCGLNACLTFRIKQYLVARNGCYV